MSVRINVSVGDDIHSWFKEESVRLSIPVSTLMHIALREHIERRTMLNMMPEAFKQMENLSSQMKDFKAPKLELDV